jgi:hypothetical protein
MNIMVIPLSRGFILVAPGADRVSSVVTGSAQLHVFSGILPVLPSGPVRDRVVQRYCTFLNMTAIAEIFGQMAGQTILLFGFGIHAVGEIIIQGMGFLEKVITLMAFLTKVLVLVTLDAFPGFSNGLILVRMQPVVRVILSQSHFSMTQVALVGYLSPLVTLVTFSHIRHVLGGKLVFFGNVSVTVNAVGFSFQMLFMREDEISSGSY